MWLTRSPVFDTSDCRRIPNLEEHHGAHEPDAQHGADPEQVAGNEEQDQVGYDGPTLGGGS